MVASFASNLIFLNFWWSKSKSNFIFMILGLKCPGLTKNFKKSKFDCTIDFLSDKSETSIFKGNLWSWCNSHLIGIPWGYKYDSNENFLTWPKIPVLPLCIRWNFIRENPNFHLFLDKSLGQFGPYGWTSKMYLSHLSHVLRHWVILRWKYQL